MPHRGDVHHHLILVQERLNLSVPSEDESGRLCENTEIHRFVFKIMYTQS